MLGDRNEGCDEWFAEATLEHEVKLIVEEFR